jgi:cobalt-zinc-cadmium efflux system protein
MAELEVAQVGKSHKAHHRHHDDCGYCHNHDYQKIDKKRLWWALAISVSMTLAELISGLLSGSLSLFADGAHMIGDNIGLGYILYAKINAHKDPTLKDRASRINGYILLAMAIYIFANAYHRLLCPAGINAEIMTGVAVAGLLVNIAMYAILHKSDPEDLAMCSAKWHVLSDTASSVGVVAGGLIIYRFGWCLIDPILGFVIGALVLNFGLRLIIKSNIRLHVFKNEKH